eukprot:jgi/Tetstr1/449895/TSEL_036954.t1
MAQLAQQAVGGPASSPGSAPGRAEQATALGKTPPTRGVADAAMDGEEEAGTGPAEPAGVAGGSGSKKAKGKKAGVPNWAPIEVVACVSHSPTLRRHSSRAKTTPESFWGKADKLKASVINHIVPIW